MKKIFLALNIILFTGQAFSYSILEDLYTLYGLEIASTTCREFTSAYNDPIKGSSKRQKFDNLINTINRLSTKAAGKPNKKFIDKSVVNTKIQQVLSYCTLHPDHLMLEAIPGLISHSSSINVSTAPQVTQNTNKQVSTNQDIVQTTPNSHSSRSIGSYAKDYDKVQKKPDVTFIN